MASNEGDLSGSMLSSTDKSNLKENRKEMPDDDYVVLEEFDNLMDSGVSSVSTVPEKQAFESLEKPPSYSSLGESTINEHPYYEKSRFMDEAYRLERKRGYFGEDAAGNLKAGEEKCDDSCGEKAHIENLVEKKDGNEVQGEVDRAVIESQKTDEIQQMEYIEKKDKKEHVLMSDDLDIGKEQKSSVNGGKKASGVQILSSGTINHPDHANEASDVESMVHCSGQELKTSCVSDRIPDDHTAKSIAGKDAEIELDREGSDANIVLCVTKAGQVNQNGGKGKENELPQNLSGCGDTITLVDGNNVENGSSTDLKIASESDTGTGKDLVKENQELKKGGEMKDVDDEDYHGGDECAGLNVGAKVVNLEHHQRGEENVTTQVLTRPAAANEGSLDRKRIATGITETSATSICGEQPNTITGDQTGLSQGMLPQNVLPEGGSGLRRRAQHVAREAANNNRCPDPGDDEGDLLYGDQGKGLCYSIMVILLIVVMALVVLFIILAAFIPAPPRSPHEPVVQIRAKKHVSLSSSSWQLPGSCRGYNSTYVITDCQWTQIHPKPSSPERTVIPEGRTECPNVGRSHNIDVTLDNLNVPTERMNYIFVLRCSDNTGHTAEERVDVWIKELNPPIITVASERVMTSTSVESVKLPQVFCRAGQGVVVSERWEFIDGPEVIADPSRDGTTKIKIPGKYKFKYKCTDTYDATASSPNVLVFAKPPYVLGIDLGTSTTCIVVIRENGTSQDINIYDGQDDTDPCMPSVVAFAHGELLIGEKAQRQAVVNPSATIYEVKRLMGRSYYDDDEPKFNYRVRPTSKSHSLKGVRAAIEIPCGKHGRKLLQPEMVSALILRHVVDYAQEHLRVPIKDVVISVPAQFDDAQRKATMDAAFIARLNPKKLVNEPTVAAFAANDLTSKWLDPDHGGNAEVKRSGSVVWAMVADIGGGTTDYALMQISGTNYKVIATGGNKVIGGRDIDIQLSRKVTEILREKYPGFDLESAQFQQRLRLECEKAKIALSEKDVYSLTIDYIDEQREEILPLEHELTRAMFEEYVLGILEAMVAPLDLLLGRVAGARQDNIEDLYLVGGTSKIPRLNEMLRKYFTNVKNVRHKDPVQLVSRGTAAFGAALAGLFEVEKMPKIDVIPLAINIAVDMDDMHVIFERNQLYPCIANRHLTTFTNNQTAILIRVYEGEGRTPDECHFLGEFELSGIPPLPKGVPKITSKFRVDANGMLSVWASYGDVVKTMTLDVYSKSGNMDSKTRLKLSTISAQLMAANSQFHAKCSLLDSTTAMDAIPPKPRKENVLKLSVDAQYDSVKMFDVESPNSRLNAIGMVVVKGLVTDHDSARKDADLDIVLVIDESGSMEGTPIETMKRVIRNLIEVLKDNHRLAVVSYHGMVHRRLELTQCTEQNKAAARRIVDDISADGSTNLYGGLLTGLRMAYHGGRRSSVLLFTDGHANAGEWIQSEDIIREIVKETAALGTETSARVELSTFGYLGNHDAYLLQQLATGVGGGRYNYLNEETPIAKGFGHVLGDAINVVAEKIVVTVKPLNHVQVLKALTNFSMAGDAGKITFEIPSTADQQSRHILLQLAVPPCKDSKVHDSLFHVELAYTNTITEREEGSEEYLIVARTEHLDEEMKSREVDEQLNRVFVVEMIGEALEELKKDNRQKAADLLREAERFVLNSISKEHTLSLCLRSDLGLLISEIEHGDPENAKKSLQDSLASHWQEKGGRSSCYLTRKEDKLISILS